MIPIKDSQIDDPPPDAPLPPKDERVVICKMKKISKIDTELVNGNISVSAALGCNTAIDFLSGPGNAQSAFFYIGNYMRKAIDRVAAILPLVHSANKKKDKYPSKARDSGSQPRNAKYLTQIILNRLHGGQEIPDQIAVSFILGYNSYISSHSFENFYPVDLYNYVKTGGKSLLSEETSELNKEDCPAEYEEDSEDETLDILASDLSSGHGQAVRPRRCKLSAEEGMKFLVRIVRDIDDYIHRGPELEDFSPYMYKMAVTRVN